MGDERRAEVGRELVHRAAGHSWAAHGATVAERREPNPTARGGAHNGTSPKRPRAPRVVETLEMADGPATWPPLGGPDLSGLTAGDSRTDEDATALRDALFAYNAAATGYRDGRSLSCFVHDDAGRLIAGIDGFTWGGYARVELLWVDEHLRGRGIGGRLLECVEDEARERSCKVLVVDSHSFQAPDFYRARGYREVGTTRDTPVGFRQHLFEKHL
jgi:ribosomal protein S18 acetylase RimI-like enzyme